MYVHSLMRFTWDPAKNAENLRVHRIGFEVAQQVFLTDYLDRCDGREDYGEDRYVAIGLIEGRCVVVVYTEREDTEVYHLISARKAEPHERRDYEDYLRRRHGR